MPTGKRLVIEYVDSKFLVGGNPGALQMSVDIADSPPNASTVFHTIGLSSESMRCSLGQSCGGVARTVKIYVEEGHTVRAEGTLVTAAAGGDAIFVGTINGHLVEK